MLIVSLRSHMLACSWRRKQLNSVTSQGFEETEKDDLLQSNPISPQQDYANEERRRRRLRGRITLRWRKALRVPPGNKTQITRKRETQSRSAFSSSLIPTLCFHFRRSRVCPPLIESQFIAATRHGLVAKTPNRCWVGVCPRKRSELLHFLFQPSISA